MMHGRLCRLLTSSSRLSASTQLTVSRGRRVFGGLCLRFRDMLFEIKNDTRSMALESRTFDDGILKTVVSWFGEATTPRIGRRL
jgi:hypothetical protein